MDCRCKDPFAKRIMYYVQSTDQEKIIGSGIHFHSRVPDPNRLFESNFGSGWRVGLVMTEPIIIGSHIVWRFETCFRKICCELTDAQIYPWKSNHPFTFWKPQM